MTISCRRSGTTALPRLLSQSLRRLLRDGSDPRRRHRYAPVVALSRGYGSTAVAVLAEENGCTRAVTLAVTVTGTDDNGLGDAARLGLRRRSSGHVVGDTVPALRVDFPPDLAAARSSSSRPTARR